MSKLFIPPNLTLEGKIKYITDKINEIDRTKKSLRNYLRKKESVPCNKKDKKLHILIKKAKTEISNLIETREELNQLLKELNKK